MKSNLWFKSGPDHRCKWSLTSYSNHRCKCSGPHPVRAQPEVTGLCRNVNGAKYICRWNTRADVCLPGHAVQTIHVVCCITCRAPSFKCNVVLKTNNFIQPLEVWYGHCCIIRSVFWRNMFMQAETEWCLERLCRNNKQREVHTWNRVSAWVLV